MVTADAAFEVVLHACEFFGVNLLIFLGWQVASNFF